MRVCKISLFKGILNNSDHQTLSKVKKTAKFFLKSPLKIKKNPGKTLEFYVESCMGTWTYMCGVMLVVVHVS
jgi:hypothetical protein